MFVKTAEPVSVTVVPVVLTEVTVPVVMCGPETWVADAADPASDAPVVAALVTLVPLPEVLVTWNTIVSDPFTATLGKLQVLPVWPEEMLQVEPCRVVFLNSWIEY